MTSSKGQDRGRRFKEIAMTVRNRDAGRCIRCDGPESDERLSVHHLVADSEVPDNVDAHLPVNLVSVCRDCHSQVESRSLVSQLREIGIENWDELMLSDVERKRLNNRLRNTGPDLLNMKTVEKKESEEFINNIFAPSGTQSSLSEFDE
ncbi:HNH endonuclease [Natronorubrum sp. DTA7]|uniref:HNH endonuclease n=1 Tax=Natronorubrum sp. DTA7 TaxID=3447016 RepID=UPI003F854FEF